MPPPDLIVRVDSPHRARPPAMHHVLRVRLLWLAGVLACLFSNTAIGQSLSSNQPNSSAMESVGQAPAGSSQQVEGLFEVPPRPECEPKSEIFNAFSVALMNPANRLEILGGLDTLMVFSTKAPFPSGIPVFLLTTSPFGADTNTFDLHARQSYLGAYFSVPIWERFRREGMSSRFCRTTTCRVTTTDSWCITYGVS
jgi:hypothetical protein